MEAIRSSEMPVTACHTTMRVKPKLTHLYRTEIHETSPAARICRK